MRTPKFITDLDFDSYHQYYEYIVESRYNGQRTQTLELFRHLEGSDKDHFWIYLAETGQDIDSWMIYFGLKEAKEE